MNKELSDWIKKGLAQGHSKEELLHQLVQGGYSPKDAHAAIARATQKGLSSKKLILINVIAVVLLGIIITLFLLLSKALPSATDSSDIAGAQGSGNDARSLGKQEQPSTPPPSSGGSAQQTSSSTTSSSSESSSSSTEGTSTSTESTEDNEQNTESSTLLCKANSDCTQVCEHCEGKETQSCIFTLDENNNNQSFCGDCVTDFSCADGYKCKENDCVQWECDKDLDCSDNNVSTKDTCTSDYLCTSETITSCTDDDFYCPGTCDETTDKDCNAEEIVCVEEIVDCGTTTDIVNDCYVDAAKGCCQAKLVSAVTVNLFELVNATTTTYSEILGMSDGGCEVLTRTEDLSLEYSEEAYQELLNEGGYTEEEITQAIEEQEQSALEDLSPYICAYPLEDLLAKLYEQQEGIISFSSSDFEKYSCEDVIA